MEKNEFNRYPLIINKYDFNLYFDESDFVKIKAGLRNFFGEDVFFSMDNKLVLNAKYEDIIDFLLSSSSLSISEITRAISWRAFERYIASFFSRHDFEVVTNLHFVYKRVRREIDIIASNMQIAFLIDAKHWLGSLAPSKLSLVADKQKERCILFVKYLFKGSLSKRHRFIKPYFSEKTLFYPLVITLYTATPQLIDDVLVFPINQIKSFLKHFDSLKETLWFISLDKI